MGFEGEVGWLEQLVPGLNRRKIKHQNRPEQSFLDGPGPAQDAVSPVNGRTVRPFPRFQSSASDQLNPQPLDRFSAVRMQLRNAFTPSQPVIDYRMFSGRTQLLTTLIRSIEEQRLHTVIYGQRGIGKTSILHVLTQLAREARYHVIYISCGASSNLEEIFRAIAAGIPLLYHSGFSPTGAEAERGATLADLLPAGPVSVRTASDMLANVTGTRVLVILDEFDRCESPEFGRNVAELLKNLSDRAVRMQLIIAGVASNLTELVEHIPSIQRNITAVQIPRMTSAEILELVKNGAKRSGLTFSDDAVQQMIFAANGLPYLASLLSQHAGLVAIDDGRTVVSSDDFSAAVTRAASELKGRISARAQIQISERLDHRSRKLLSALSRGAQHVGGQFGIADIKAMFQQPTVMEECLTLIESLASEGVLIEIQPEGSEYRYRFIEEGVASYLWLLAARSR